MTNARQVLLAAVVLGMAAPLAAQDKPRERLSVSVGGGIADPFHGDFDFVATAWAAGVRAAPSDHLRVEVSVGQWRHTTGHVVEHITAQGRDGPLGTIDRLSEQTRWTVSSIGINFLAAGSAGRATFSGGGGPGLMLIERTFTQTSEGCSGTVSCASYANTYHNSSFAVQAVAALDVAITPRVGAFGQVQIVVPSRDVGSGHTALLAGVRLRIM